VSAVSRPTRNLQPRSNFLAHQRQFLNKFLPHEVPPYRAVASIETANKLAGLALVPSLGCGPSGPLLFQRNPGPYYRVVSD